MSRARDLIEAYALRPEEAREETQRRTSTTNAPEEAAAGLARAFDFLDSCVIPFDEAEPTRTVEPAIDPAVPAPKHTAWRIPRGLLYWLSVAAAASVVWRSTESLLQAAIAALLASAAIMVFEIGLRMIDPRLARRLGLAQGRATIFL